MSNTHAGIIPFLVLYIRRYIWNDDNVYLMLLQNVLFYTIKFPALPGTHARHQRSYQSHKIVLLTKFSFLLPKLKQPQLAPKLI